MNKYFFSILIPSYNSKETIFKLIDNLNNQKFSNFEVLICDQSDDGTFDLLFHDLEKHSNYQLFRQEIPNVMAARILLFSKATGKYIISIDADDEIFPNSLQIIHDVLDKSSLDLLQVKMLSNNKQFVSKKYDSNYNLIEYSKDLFLSNFNNSLGTKIIKREITNIALKENSILNIRNGDDSALNIIFLPYIKNFLYCDIDFYIYNYNNESITHKINVQRLFYDFYNYYQTIFPIYETYGFQYVDERDFKYSYLLTLSQKVKAYFLYKTVLNKEIHSISKLIKSTEVFKNCYSFKNIFGGPFNFKNKIALLLFLFF